MEKLARLGPERRDTLRTVVDVDIKAVCFVVILHPSEDIIVDIAEKVDVGLDAPVVLDVLERWVLTEHATVPPAHLMVRVLLHVLHLLIDE